MGNLLNIALNAAVPGAGLILLRRERVGVALAACFFASAHLVVLGRWGIPASLPYGLTVASAGFAVALWVVSQVVFWSRLREFRNPAVVQQKITLVEIAREAIADGIYVNARIALESALALDDEDLTANLLWARLLTTVGRFPEARRAWRRVEELDRAGEYRQETGAALQQIPS